MNSAKEHHNVQEHLQPGPGLQVPSPGARPLKKGGARSEGPRGMDRPEKVRLGKVPGARGPREKRTLVPKGRSRTMSKTSTQRGRSKAGQGFRGERKGSGLAYQPPTGLGKVQL